MQSLHKSLAFPDKIKQIHVYFETRGLLGDATTGKKKSTGKSEGREVTAYLKTTADSWGMKPASMGQLVTLAKCTGRGDNLLQILHGQYRVPGAKAVGGPPPKAVSHFNNLGNVPPNVTADLFAQIIAGNLALNKLPKACTDYKAMHHLKLYVLDTATNAFPSKGITSWEKLMKTFPAVCSKPFLHGWVSSIIVKHDKISEPPKGLKDAIIEQCTEKQIKVHNIIDMTKS